jgi:hypothetical protein
MSRYNNLNSEGSPDLLNSNISRLVKLAKDTNTPGKVFTDSLTDDAVSELKRLEAKRKHRTKTIIPAIRWLEKTAGWAAMIVAACGAGLVSVIPVFLQLNAIFVAVTSVTMFFNWLNYFGELIL